MKHSNLKEQLASVGLQVAMAAGASFLYAAVVRHAWLWFVGPSLPSVPQDLGYGRSYGLVLAAGVVYAMIANPTAPSRDESDQQSDHPFLWPIIKRGIKTAIVLALWGVAAIAHAVIG